MKPQPHLHHATLVQAAADGDEAPTGGGSDPIPAGTGMPIPGGRSFEPPEGGGQDDSPPKTTTSMPLKGR